MIGGTSESGDGARDRARPVAAAGALAAALLASFCGPVLAQPVEENPARILPGQRIAALPGADVAVDELDDTPLGVDLSGIVVVSSEAALQPAVAVDGVVVRSDNARLTDPALAATLRPFLGAPLSQRLIGQVRDAIVRHMRESDRPLVAVIVPPQEITSGAIQLLVLPYTVGERRVERVATGYETTDEARLLDAIRVRPGDEVAAGVLLADVNWLNLNPFRDVGVVFQPGADVGTTDLILRLSDRRPWQVYAGYANSGTEATVTDRLFAGFVAVPPGWGDQQFSYQYTAAPQTILSNGDFFNGDRDASYQAHAAGYFVPLPWRHKLTARAQYVESRTDLVDPFVQDGETWEAGLEYAVPVMPALDVFGGLEFKRQSSDLLFDGTSVRLTTIDVAQALIGVRGEVTGPGRRTAFDLQGVFSPGGVTGDNSDFAFAAASGHPGDTAQYAYLLGGVTHWQALPREFGLVARVSGQLAATNLPQIEQFDIGGATSVRGYETNERVGDHGVFAQAELHLPPLPFDEGGLFAGTLDIYAFVDSGLVHSLAADTSHSLLGAGLGMVVGIGENLQVSLAWGHAFRDGPVTAGGSDRIHASVTLTY